jgi:plastocyanin
VRVTLHRYRRRALVTLTALAAGSWPACFSERQPEVTGPPTGECRIDLTSPVVGELGVVVALRDFKFYPEEVRVPRGTRVTWVNCESPSIDAHTTTSDASVWASPFMTSGQAFSHVFDQAGRFPYHCIPHASFMRGVIVVE